MPTIGLGMMVRDEAGIVERALASAARLVDYMVVVDTGSTDETRAVVARYLELNRMPSWQLDEEWRDFGYNRSFVLAKMRQIPHIDYCLMLDADEEVRLTADSRLLKESLSADCYKLAMHRGSLVYDLPRLTSNRRPFRYLGPAHEWLDCLGESYRQEKLPDLSLHATAAGARTRDPDRYRREAEMFERLLEEGEKDPFRRARYCFYLAQSWRDAGEPWAALRCYQNRADMGGWHEEVYVSLLNAGRLMERLNQPLTAILDTYHRARVAVPARAEAIHAAARLCRVNRLYGEGYSLARLGIKLPLADGLFVEEWIYRWGLLDEFAICAYWAGEKTESWLACQALLLRRDLDGPTRERIEKNAAFAR